MKRLTIIANSIKTICWNNGKIVDWASGIEYSLDGSTKRFQEYYAYSFDSAISSKSGEYAFIYKKLGTKGILLKNGQFIREINRPYYFANAYEYPAALVTIGNQTYLIHCPIAYNQLDFEDVETGEILTNTKSREPEDSFYSRLEISPDGAYLMSKGWVWHPLSEVIVFNIEDCIDNPQLLDRPQYKPNVGVEICTASFIDNDRIVIGSSDEIFNENMMEYLPPKHISVWNFKTNQLSSPIDVKVKIGNLFAIDGTKVWDLLDFPKIIDMVTGEVIEQDNEVDSGKQQDSIINDTNDYPSITFDRKTKQVAIKKMDIIEVLAPSSF
jgi:hypothetical protein